MNSKKDNSSYINNPRGKYFSGFSACNPSHVREDCYWYEYESDMGARIPYCGAKRLNRPIEPSDCNGCKEYHSKLGLSNGDKIRRMTDEELADLICQILTYHDGKIRCPKECPLYECCNDQPTDNIEGWLRLLSK